jgi:hypothetical protein
MVRWHDSSPHRRQSRHPREGGDDKAAFGERRAMTVHTPRRSNDVTPDLIPRPMPDRHGIASRKWQWTPDLRFAASGATAERDLILGGFRHE